MERSPSWEANRQSASQEIPRLLWKPTVHYRVDNSPQLVPILSQILPVHTFPHYFLNIHSNIILQLHLDLPCRPSGFPIKILYAFLFHLCYTPRPSHPPWLDHPNNICWSVHVMTLLNVQFSPFSQSFLPLSSKYSPLHSVLRHLQSMFFL